MKLKNYFFLVLFITSSLTSLFGQSSRSTIGGVVKDARTHETLIGVPIGVKELPNIGASTNEYGFYSLTLPQGEYTLVVSYLGYDSQEVKIVLNKNVTQPILLSPAAISLDEVVVTSRRKDDNVTNVQSGVEKITLNEINKIPVLFGERDIIKTLQLLPGVKSAGEGSSGFYVRGGAGDQNAILLDNAPIYNAAHLLGFFSTFNPDAVKDVTLYKGAQPAEFGGRLASVLDVQMNDGSNQDFHVGGGIGLIASRLSLEGPIQKGKSAFLVTGRRTYADMFARLSNSESAKNTQLYFYDLNAKVNYIVSDKDRLFLSGYFGKDKLSLTDIIGTEWGNIVGSLRWNRLITNKLFSNTTLIYNQYAYNIDLAMDLGLHISSKINDYGLKQEFQYYHSPSSTWRFGFNTTYHNLQPGRAEFDEAKGTDKILQNRYSWDNAIYGSNTLKINDELEVIYGLRMTTFSVLGKGNFYTLDDNNNVIDTTSYASGEVVKTYFNLEPRLSLVYRLDPSSSVKSSYGRTTQNMHLISNSAMTGAFDRWASSSNIIRPQISDQVTLGYFRNFSDNMFEFSVEGYYKMMQNQIDFKDNAETYRTDNFETELLFGKGRAYGVEFLLRKNIGRFTGWVGYTLSKSEKKIDGINRNEWYVATQDRTHDISVVLMYELNKKWSLSSSWVYNTGNAVTYPSGKYEIDGMDVVYYTERNGYRAPAYHRLDLGANCVLKKTKKFFSELSFSLYNAYGRENAYLINFKTNKDDPSKTTAYQYSLFRFVPSITWNFKY